MITKTYLCSINGTIIYIRKVIKPKYNNELIIKVELETNVETIIIKVIMKISWKIYADTHIDLFQNSKNKLINLNVNYFFVNHNYCFRVFPSMRTYMYINYI